MVFCGYSVKSTKLGKHKTVKPLPDWKKSGVISKINHSLCECQVKLLQKLSVFLNSPVQKYPLQAINSGMPR
jgi:hypothetical protein